MVFVLGTGMMVNANSSVEKINVEKLALEEVGCAGNCVRASKEKAGFIAAVTGESRMSAYKILYAECYYANCAQ